MAGGDWAEINYKDQRNNENKRVAPAEAPKPKKVREPSPPPPQDTTKKSNIVSYWKQQEEDKERKERLLQMEKKINSKNLKKTEKTILRRIDIWPISKKNGRKKNKRKHKITKLE